VSTPLPVAATWFASTPVDAAITLFTEPHVHPLPRANFWHVRGRDRDLVLDCGLGVTDLRRARPELFEHDPILVLSHAHLDHMGSAHEFDEVWAHPGEAAAELPVHTVHAGHDSSFDGTRLHDIIDTYLRVRSTRSPSVRKVRQ
jgi:glyoxylase-like metal-dependent hydrolase (beta-lactamase superfamily II)